MSEFTASAPIAWWLAEIIDDAVRRAVERSARLPDVQSVAVMPDVHLAADVCVGTAMATRSLIYPSAVGGDIGCGMLALGFDVDARALDDGAIAGKVLHALQRAIPGSRHHRTRMMPWPESLDPRQLSHAHLQAIARDEGVLQLGTVGGGNHFVELQRDEVDDRLWLMIHTGSRAMGQAVRAHHVAIAMGLPGAAWPPSLDVSTDAGRAYLNDSEWCGAYAGANRRAIASRVTEVLHDVLGARADESTTIAVDHNHVRVEDHFGEPLLVHRKGAMPASEGSAGVVPGSMGTRSYHVEGRGCAKSLRSSAHGAGRRHSRAAARERFGAGDVKHQLRGVWYDPRQTHALREELPHAYKDVRAVLRAQEELVKVTRTLRPVLSHKA
jgi:tRNA-splicing ligase RtcB (3'-phosphate/5'-hydroxy nucleic acid ligase)